MAALDRERGMMAHRTSRASMAAFIHGEGSTVAGGGDMQSSHIFGRESPRVRDRSI
jgi:hypothetical protein